MTRCTLNENGCLSCHGRVQNALLLLIATASLSLVGNVFVMRLWLKERSEIENLKIREGHPGTDGAKGRGLGVGHLPEAIPRTAATGNGDSVRSDPGKKDAAVRKGTDYTALYSNPSTFPVWQALERRNLKRIYGNTVSAMGLQPQDEAKLWALLLEKSEATMDSYQVSKDGQLSAAESGVAWRQAQADVNADVTALIGQANAELLDSPTSRMLQLSIGADLAVAGTPLSPQQLAALANAYNAVGMVPGFGAPGQENAVIDPATGLNRPYSTVLEQISPTLSSEQRTAFLEYAQEQSLLQKIRTGAGN